MCIGSPSRVEKTKPSTKAVAEDRAGGEGCGGADRPTVVADAAVADLADAAGDRERLAVLAGRSTYRGIKHEVEVEDGAMVVRNAAHTRRHLLRALNQHFQRVSRKKTAFQALTIASWKIPFSMTTLL